jgi:DNA segregation ATPase FtsK/SpoIIIE-like protein
VIPFGYDSKDKLILDDINELKNMIMTGITAAGKSMYGHILINSLMSLYQPSKVKFLLIDMGRADFFRYNNSAHLTTSVKHETSDAFSTLELLTDLQEERMNIKNHRDPEYILVLIETFSELIKHNKNWFERIITNLTKNSKKSGIYVIMWDSQVKQVYTKPIRVSFSTKLLLFTQDVKDSLDFCGIPDGNSLSGMGDMLLCKPEDTNKIRLQVPYISDNEIMELNRTVV